METQNGHPLSDDQTARLMATFKGDLLRCKEELLLYGIPSVEEETGIWYCRRMVKETAKAEKCSASGKRGGGNPNISNYKQKPETRDHISLKVTFKGRTVDVNGFEGIPEQAYDLAAMMATSVIRKDPANISLSDARFNTTMNEWAYKFKSLNDAGRSWKEIKDVLVWAMEDNFWSTVVITADKFSNKFSDLLIQSNRKLDKSAPAEQTPDFRGYNV